MRPAEAEELEVSFGENLRAIILICVVVSIMEVLRRFAETVHFSCNMANKCCGDLRRRRVHTKTVCRNCKVLAREMPP